MKFQVMFKTPDALDEGVEEALDRWYNKLKADAGAIESLESFTDEDLGTIRDRMRDKLRSAALNWISWGEYLTVEIDVEGDSCRVLRSK